MRAIGGYFSLELAEGESYHPQALALNTGRGCLEYILKCRGYKKVYIPYYTCDSILQPFQNLGVEYEYYNIDRGLELANELRLDEGEGLLYTNYFGLKQGYVELLADRYGKQLIVDDTQAFYAKRVGDIDTFYSARKFFGVPDGAYLYTDCALHEAFERDCSCERMSHLLKRIDLGAEAGYQDFKKNDEVFDYMPIMYMSRLTERLLAGIDYESISRQRRLNYMMLEESLRSTNMLDFKLDAESVPMVYPYLPKNGGLREKLISNRIFVACYWPNVLEWCDEWDLEWQLAKNVCFLPIDQRYDENDMDVIIRTVINENI